MLRLFPDILPSAPEAWAECSYLLPGWEGASLEPKNTKIGGRSLKNYTNKPSSWLQANGNQASSPPQPPTPTPTPRLAGPLAIDYRDDRGPTLESEPCLSEAGSWCMIREEVGDGGLSFLVCLSLSLAPSPSLSPVSLGLSSFTMQGALNLPLFLCFSVCRYPHLCPTSLFLCVCLSPVSSSTCCASLLQSPKVD